MRLLNDGRGRVPFALLGVFLIIGSAVTSGIVTTLEREHSKNMSAALQTATVKYMIKNAEADIARALSYSCLQALKTVGETPVTYSSVPTEAAEDYADFDGDDSYEDDVGSAVDTEREAMLFNRNWARNMARVHLNDYLNATFRRNIFQDHGFAVNVYDPEDNGAVDDWRDIEFSNISMGLERAVEINLLISETDNEYTTYWVASIDDFSIEIRNLSSGKEWERTINISSLIPSRLPLLWELTNTYNRSINGFPSPLMGFITVIGEGYTEVRSLLQYAGKYNWVKNIVDNRWLQYLTNTGLVAIQYLVFNSIDPMTLAQLAVNVNDLVARGTNYGTDSISDILTSMVSLPINNQRDVFKTFGSENEADARETLNHTIGSEETTKANVSIWNISRSILNESTTTYYYYNESADPQTKTETKWRGYNFTEDGYVYRLSSRGDHPDENTTSYTPSFVREYLPQINETVLEEISETIVNTYAADFSTEMFKRITSENRSPDPADDWDLESHSSWDLVSSTCSGDSLNDGELPRVPYTEQWTLEWERSETWNDTDCEVVNGNRTCNTTYHDVTHSVTEEVDFTLHATPAKNGIRGVFYNKSAFGSPPHKEEMDDNLQFLLQKYVDDHFTEERDYYTDIAEDAKSAQVADSYPETLARESWRNNTADGDSEGYDRISWIYDRPDAMGAAVKALHNITRLIKADREDYSNISRSFYSEDDATVNLSVMEQERQALLEEFQQHKDRYINEDYYMEDDEYRSAAARVIVEMRRWFVEEIEERLSTSYQSHAEDKINERLDSTNTGNFEGYQSYQNNLDRYKGSVSQLSSIQFGNQMTLEEDWVENITLTISTTPDYFDFESQPSEEENWQFNVKNICLFGPTGLPLLPTPATPWVATLNTWYIHVDGHWDTFQVLDSSDETHADSLFGHSGQVYARGQRYVFDDTCSNGAAIGNCSRLGFGFDTMSLGIVPPGKLPIGDLGNPVESNSVGN